MNESKNISALSADTEKLLAILEMQKQQLKEKDELIREKDEQILKQEMMLKVKDEEYEALNSKYLLLQRQLFGYRSEKRIPDPVTNRAGWLFQSDWEVEYLEVEKEVKPIQDELVEKEKQLSRQREINKKTEKTTKTRNLRIDPNVPIEQILHQPVDFDPEQHEKIGERTRDILQVRPSTLYVERHVYPVYKKRGATFQDDPNILRAPLENSNGSGVKIGNTIYATMIVDKFKYHIPEHRQLKRYKEMGIELSKSTINRGINDISSKLFPLYQVLMDEVLTSDYIQMDESVMRIRDRKNKTRKGYVWAARAMNAGAGVFFYYDEGSRSADTLASILRDYQGAIQSDGYAAYSRYENKKGVTPLACMAHVRRKFEQATKEGDSRADDMLRQIALLYALEAQLKEEEAPPEKIHSERMRLAAPILRAMECWMQKTYNDCTPKSTLGKAITYAHTVWIRLCRYCTNGRYEIDNNGMERVMRYIAMGRQNYLFVNNDDSAEHYARIYSFMASCESSRISFFDWLLVILPRIDQLSTLSTAELKALLPSQRTELKGK